MSTLRLPATVVRKLRSELIQEDEKERFAFLYAGGDGEFLGSQIHTVSETQMARQSKTACRPAPEVERDHVGTCYDRQLVPVLVHSHPFSTDPQFSSLDVESMGRFREWITGLFPNEPFGFAVVGTRGIDAVGYHGDLLEATSIEVIGPWKLDEPVTGARSRFAVDGEQPTTGSSFPTERVNGDMDFHTVDAGSVSEGLDRNQSHEESAETANRERFDRGIRALGVAGQQRLAATTVGVVGVGGLGSIVAEQLARLGVGTIVLVDDDVVERSNLPRLAGAYDHHVGKPKVDVVREHLWKCNPELTVDAVETRVQDQPDVLDRCDAVIGCVDAVTARSFCNEYAVKQLTYYIDAGVRIDVTDEQTVQRTGYVHLVAPGSNGCLDCLGRHDQAAARIEQLSPAERTAERERGYVDDDQLRPEPALIHLNGLCASKAVSVFVDLVTGDSQPPDFIRYEDHKSEMAELTTDPSEACPTCGEDGVLGVGRRSFGSERFVPEPDQARTD